MHISKMCRLVRGTGHILDVLDVLHRNQVAPGPGRPARTFNSLPRRGHRLTAADRRLARRTRPRTPAHRYRPQGRTATVTDNIIAVRRTR
ncbi:hypothetical protein NKH18_39475 [Streptomyces sp. M10(2022)]